MRTADHALTHACETKVVQLESRSLARSATSQLHVMSEVADCLVTILAANVWRRGQRALPSELLRLTDGGSI